MKKYYKVGLYKLCKTGAPVNYIKKVDEIIVDYSPFLEISSEIMTKLCIAVFPNSCMKEEMLLPEFCNRNDLNNYGFQLFTLKGDYIKKNRINEKELDLYIESFENSEYRKIYETMKILSIEEKKNIRQKIKSISGKYQ